MGLTKKSLEKVLTNGKVEIGGTKYNAAPHTLEGLGLYLKFVEPISKSMIVKEKFPNQEIAQEYRTKIPLFYNRKTPKNRLEGIK